MKSSAVLKLLSLITACLTPIVLILTTIRLLLMPWFLTFEYHTPGFPEDPYGFTIADRLTYASYAVDYLINDADISYLANLRFPQGITVPEPSCHQMSDCSFLYNERELSHMKDVKQVTQQVLRVWRIALILLGILAVLAWTQGWKAAFVNGLAAGSRLTAILCCLLLLGVFLSFGVLFVLFHDIFFTPGTWMFLTSDTLIRLFPERFWRDVFLIALGIPALSGAALGWGLSRFSSN